MNYEQFSPDDLDEIKLFTNAILKKVTQFRLERAIRHFLELSLVNAKMVTDLIGFESCAQVEQSLGIAATISLYAFIKKNEVAVKALMEIKEEGEPFLNDYISN